MSNKKKKDGEKEGSEKKKNNLEGVVAQINKKYGKGTILRAGEANTLVIDRISSGVFSLNIGIGGGWPRGRISQIKGEYSSGKSVLTYLAIAQAQLCDRYTGKPFGTRNIDGSIEYFEGFGPHNVSPMRAVVQDAEGAWDSDFAAKWGVDVDQVYVIQAEYTEQGVDIADLFIRSKECDLLVVDSVAALAPSKEVEDSVEKWHVGVQARLMNKALRKWTSGMNSYGLLADTKCTVLLVNQMRIDLSGYYTKMTSPGGKGLDFFSSVIIKVNQIEEVLDPHNGRFVGGKVEFIVEKNKTAPKTHGGQFQLFYAHSPTLGYRAGQTDNARQILQLAAYWGYVQKAGAWFSIDGVEKSFQGMDNFSAHLQAHPEIIERLKGRVKEREMGWLTTGDAPEVRKKKDDKEKNEEET